MRIEDRQDHRKAALVPADDGASRRAESGRRYQRLDLYKQRPGALHAGKYCRTGRAGMTFAEEQGGGVGDLPEAAARHLEDADLVGWAEAILDGAEDAEMVATLALEIEDGVDHV